METKDKKQAGAAAKKTTKAATGKAAVTQKTAAAAAPKDDKVQSGYPIESGVEVPSKRTIASKYPFADMAVGQSFRTPLTTEDPLGKTDASKVARSLGSAASRYGTNNSKKFTTRVMKEEGDKKGYFVRCWRLN